MGDLFSAFRVQRGGGQNVLLALVVPQGSLIQTNAFATLAYLGVTCPEPQHDACLMAALSSGGDHGLHVTGPGPTSDHAGILTSGMRGPLPQSPTTHFRAQSWAFLACQGTPPAALKFHFCLIGPGSEAPP